MIEAIATKAVDLRPGLVLGPAEKAPRRASAVRTDVACMIRVRRLLERPQGSDVVVERLPHLSGAREPVDGACRVVSRCLDGWVEEAFRGEFRTRRPAAARMYFQNGGERLWLLDLDFWVPAIDPASLREDEDPSELAQRREDEATLHFYSCALERIDDLGGAEVSQLLFPELWLRHPQHLPQVWALAATFCKRTGNRFVVADSAPPRGVQELEWRAAGIVEPGQGREIEPQGVLDWFADSPWSTRRGLSPEVALTGAAVLRTSELLSLLSGKLGLADQGLEDARRGAWQEPEAERLHPALGGEPLMLEAPLRPVVRETEFQEVGRPGEVALMLQRIVGIGRGRDGGGQRDGDLLQEGRRHSPILSCLGVYWPWLRSPRGLDVPPSCAVAGVYARSDQENAPVGCQKPPANELVRGVTDLSIYLDEAPQNLLERMGVNLLQSRPNRGILVWGARTSCEDELWRSVHVRRLVGYIGKQIETDHQWAIFENNTDELRLRLVRDVGQFLRKLWEWGAIVGESAEGAFRVQCDDENNPPWMRDQGMLMVEVWVRPVQANEFIHLNLTWGDASVERQG